MGYRGGSCFLRFYPCAWWGGIGVFSLLVVGCMIWYSCKEALLRFLDSDDSDSSQS